MKLLSGKLNLYTKLEVNIGDIFELENFKPTLAKSKPCATLSRVLLKAVAMGIVIIRVTINRKSKQKPNSRKNLRETIN